MAIEVETKDTTALSDTELAEMAELCAESSGGVDLGLISKQAGEWVLITRASEAGALVGFSFATLERIGGTPSLMIGLACFAPGEVGQEALLGALTDQYRRALLAFPDEDVLLGTRVLEPKGFRAFTGLAEVVPRPGHRATGEERAWGRRLAKRFGCEGRLNDRSFVLDGGGSQTPALDYQGSAPAELDAEFGEFFVEVDRARGDALVAFGWAMAEDLAAGTLPG